VKRDPVSQNVGTWLQLPTFRDIMINMTKRDLILAKAKRKGVISASDLESLGASSTYLAKLVERGDLERLARGRYQIASRGSVVESSIRTVCSRAPRAVICLSSALAFHGIGTQMPNQVWLAVDRKSRPPKLDDIQATIIRMTDSNLKKGVATYRLDGVSARITNPSQTIVDCFRFRSKVGMDVAIEALRDGLRSKKATPDQLFRAAKSSRMWTVIRPYLEMSL
jgi:predicted transcriptional regulator of viral defense system